MRILLVEDEVIFAEALAEVLKRNKYVVDVAHNGMEGEEMGETDIYDLWILDRMLPKKDGVEVLKYLRSLGLKTPAIFLTAKDEISARVEGLDAGADDYLVKPFAMDELLARVRALARRRETNLINEEITVANLVLEPLKSQVRVGDKVIHLTIKENQLLEVLMLNKNQVLTKEQLLEKVWGFDSEADLNSVEIYVYYLRKKIDLKKAGVVIETKRGIGYCLKEKS